MGCLDNLHTSSGPLAPGSETPVSSELANKCNLEIDTCEFKSRIPQLRPYGLQESFIPFSNTRFCNSTTVRRVQMTWQSGCSAQQLGRWLSSWIWISPLAPDFRFLPLDTWVDSGSGWPWVPSRVSSPWLWDSLALAIAGIYGVNQQMGAPSLPLLSLSTSWPSKEMNN